MAPPLRLLSEDLVAVSVGERVRSSVLRTDRRVVRAKVQGRSKLQPHGPFAGDQTVGDVHRVLLMRNRTLFSKTTPPTS